MKDKIVSLQEQTEKVTHLLKIRENVSAVCDLGGAKQRRRKRSGNIGGLPFNGVVRFALGYMVVDVVVVVQPILWYVMPKSYVINGRPVQQGKITSNT